MFFCTGEQRLSLDDKGRMRIPMKMFEKLGKDFVVYAGTNDCLFVVPMKDFQEKYYEISQDLLLNEEEKHTIVQTLIAGLVNVISNDIFFGLIPSATIVTWMTNIIFPLFDINLEKFKEERAKEDEKTEEYNLKNGEDLTTEERLSRQKSISGKIGYGIKKGASTVKNGISRGISWLGENGSRVGSFITDTGSNLISHGRKTVRNIGKSARNTANNVLGNVTDDDKIRKRFGLNDNVKVTLRDRAVSGAGYAISKLTGGDADTTAKVLNGQLLTVQKYAGKAAEAYNNGHHDEGD